MLKIDVREPVTTLPHTPETVDELRDYDMGTARYRLPRRIVEFANDLVDILEQQGKHAPDTPEWERASVRFTARPCCQFQRLRRLLQSGVCMSTSAWSPSG